MTTKFMSGNKQFYYINSGDRNSGTPSQFSIELEIPITEDFDTICLTQASMPVSYYLVVAGSNLFGLIENGIETVITIPAGNYNINSFSSIVSGLMTSNSPNHWTYTMTYPSSFTQNNIGKITYSVSGNSSQPSLHMNPVGNHLNYLYQQFGFGYQSINTFVGNTITSTNVVSFINENSIYLHCDLIDNGSDDILQEIYSSNTIALSMLSYLCPDIEAYSKRLRVNSAKIANFYLTDENNKPIDLNGLDWVFTIVLYKRNDFFTKANLFMKYLLESQNEDVNTEETSQQQN